MGAIACANGGIILRDLHMPDFRQYAVPVVKPAASRRSDAREVRFTGASPSRISARIAVGAV